MNTEKNIIIYITYFFSSFGQLDPPAAMSCKQIVKNLECRVHVMVGLEVFIDILTKEGFSLLHAGMIPMYFTIIWFNLCNNHWLIITMEDITQF